MYALRTLCLPLAMNHVLFPKYSRSLFHPHKYDVTPSEYIYIDKRCRGDKDSPSKGKIHLIAYGIEGKQSDVNSDVNDARCLLESDKITFTTPVEVKDPVNPQNPVTKKVFDNYLEPVFFCCGGLVRQCTCC